MQANTLAQNYLDWFMTNIMPIGIIVGLSLLLIIMAGLAVCLIWTGAVWCRNALRRK
jgi:hypothetical protein